VRGKSAGRLRGWQPGPLPANWRLPLHGIENAIIDALRSLYDAIGWPGVVLAMAIESACVPIPSEVIMPLAGWLLVKEHGLGYPGILLAGVLGALGCTIGSAITYGIGAWGGRPLAERYGGYVLVTRRDLDRMDHWFARYGDIIAFASRLLPVVRTFVSLPAGVARTNFPKFLLYTFLGSFLWALGLAWAGYQLGAHYERIREVMRPFDIPIILVVLAFAAWHVRHKLQERREERAEAARLVSAGERE
jgi:membrane protein DedA with SNARE-associated domain